MALYKCYTWSYQTQVPPFERLVDVLEAFFASYPGGEYTCEERHRYTLRFRRGQWKRLLMMGPLVPARLAPGQFNQWPVLLTVLVRPAPSAYTATVRYELYLPRSIRTLSREVQANVDLHARHELKDLADYLADCTGLEQPPKLLPLP